MGTDTAQSASETLTLPDVAESNLDKIVTRLAAQTNRPEATTQGDIYALLTEANIGLADDDVVQLEAQVGDGTRRRIDVEIGQCVIEVKKNLHAVDLPKAEEQLAGYVEQRSETIGHYVGILTDGSEWRLYQLDDGKLVWVSTHTVSKQNPDADELLVWLESVLSTQESINPVPSEIKDRLGAESPAHQLDAAELRAIYETHKNDAEIKLKRELWAKLLRAALGTGFEDTDELFINHTLLVTTAELIAHAVLKFDVGTKTNLTAKQITSGSEFSNARIRGVVEADFFDWVTDTPAGESFVRNLGRRIARFNWGAVEHDVLKVLYESVITKDVRERMGEYYTPDWLANQVVGSAAPDPLSTVVADPACGSGTFLFHAIRRYLAAAQVSGASIDDAVQNATAHVVGMDVHPVAVTLARVTYLLALGRENITSSNRKELTIPVYLGDSIQWEQDANIFATDVVKVSTAGDDLVGGQGSLIDQDLEFPRSILKNATQFDYLVSAMADKALTTEPKDAKKIAATVLKGRGIAPDGKDGQVLTDTFRTLCELRKQNRNHIWGYFVRNLIRPLWLSEPENRVDVLVGNPPWLRYNKMTGPMQKRYQALAKPRNLLSGALGAAARDLSTLFVVRAVELYLRNGGSFAFVMPHGIMTRKPHTGFRSGKWSISEELMVQFGVSWDLSATDTGFPMTSCVVIGSRAETANKMPTAVSAWVGRLTRPDVPWSVARKKITISATDVAVLDHGVAKRRESPYKSRFRAGAILYPRSLLCVIDAPTGPLGAGAGRRAVTSFRSTLEKKPWNSAKSITANVENSFIRPVFLGETVLPFRTTTPREAVLPLTDSGLLSPDDIESRDGLNTWWSEAESTWERLRPKTEKKPLSQRIDYHAQLSAQLPVAPTRVVYTASGNTLAAAIVRDGRAVIEHKLYWAPTFVESEAHYLAAILNSAPILTEVKPLQAIGLFGARDFDKNVFTVPFPTYNNENTLHIELAELGKQAENEAATVDISSCSTFQAARKLIRDHLAEVGVQKHIVDAVTKLLLAQKSLRETGFLQT